MNFKRFIILAALIGAATMLVFMGCGMPSAPAAELDDGSSRDTGSCSAGSFTVSFSGASFVTGLGGRTGSSKTISWSGSCSNCNWGPAVYGWMQNPLVEYYIPRSGGASNKGTYTADGRTYTLTVDRRNNQPSIEGTASFD